MRLRRVAPVLLMAALLAGGAASGFRSFADSRAEKPHNAVTPARERDGRASIAASEAAALSQERRIEAIARARTGAPATLNGDEAALLAETSELQLLAAGTDLALDSAQWTKLASVALELEAVRQTYEAEIASAVAVAPGKFRVEIPSYAAAGAALRAKFYAELERALGTAVAADVADKIGARLEARFGGFGLSVQTLDIAADSNRGLADCVVTRTVTYAMPDAGGERVMKRQEMFMPAAEDPTGERWGPMLARLAM
jgi:hypothetical protein